MFSCTNGMQSKFVAVVAAQMGVQCKAATHVSGPLPDQSSFVNKSPVLACLNQAPTRKAHSMFDSIAPGSRRPSIIRIDEHGREHPRFRLQIGRRRFQTVTALGHHALDQFRAGGNIVDQADDLASPHQPGIQVTALQRCTSPLSGNQ
jgi:hypothetical protein